MPFRTRIRPKLRKLQDRLNQMLDRYHAEHPYGNESAQAKLQLLKVEVGKEFEKLDGELEDLFEEVPFLQDVLKGLEKKRKK